MKTGIGILGRPNNVLINDIKFQGSVKVASILAGERLAEASLAAEVLTLRLAGISEPNCEFHKYTGRSQYPRFKLVPITSNNRNKFVFVLPALEFWNRIFDINLCELFVC